MNAFAPVTGLIVRPADLSQEEERRTLAVFVEGEASAGLFHRPEWSLAVERGCGQRSRYLLAEDASGVQGVLPLTETRSLLFGSALVSSGFGVGGGIAARTDRAARLLADEAWKLAQQLGLASVELRGGPGPAEWQPKTDLYAGFARDLPLDEEAILKSIPRKQRAEVRRAPGHGLEIRIGTGRRDREDHYSVYRESVHNLGTPVFPKRLFDAMLDGFEADADIVTVSRQGRPIASVLSFYHRNIVYPYWGGGSREARASRANDLMYFALMRHAAARGCNRFDFGRSKLGTGAYSFKKNWGFEPCPLVYWTKGKVRETNPLSPKYRLQVEIWKRLPRAIANGIGPLIARGLG